MKRSAILREVGLNLTTGTSRAATFALLLALIIGSVSTLDIATTRAIISDAQQYREAGGSVLVLSAPDRIDGATCDALGRIDGVGAAGALQESEERIVASALPSTSIPTFTATVGLIRILGAESPIRDRRAGVIVSEEVATSLGLSPGDEWSTSAGAVPVAEVYPYPDDGRRPGLGYAALIPVPTNGERFDECWLEAWPPLADAPALLQMSVLPAAGDQLQPQLSQLNTTLGTSFDGTGKFESRITRWGYLMSGVLAFGTGWFAVRMRRLELASALHAGVPRRSLSTVIGLEAFAWVLAASALWLGVTLFAASGAPPGDRFALIALGARVWFAGVVGVTFGLGTGIIRTRERDLFRAFKER